MTSHTEEIRNVDLPLEGDTVQLEDCFRGSGEMSSRMRAFDWSGSALGPVSGWPRCLRTAIGSMLSSSSAVAVAWGPDLHFLYNDQYSNLLGSAKHPDALGRPAREIFPEAWEAILPHFERARRGETFTIDHWYLPLARSNYLESCWFSLWYSPIWSDRWDVSGLLTIATEATSRVEEERRLRTLRELAGHCMGAQSTTQVLRSATRAFERNDVDVPFAIFYVVTADRQRATRAVSAGLHLDHPAQPETIDLAAPGEQTWPLARVLAEGRPLVVTDLPVRFGWITGGAFPEPTHTALLLPLQSARGQAPGILIAGVSPRRALDQQYRAFYELVSRQIGRALRIVGTVGKQRGRAKAMLELNRQRTTMLAGASQKLREPLALVMGPIEGLLDGTYGPLTELQRSEVERVQRSALVLHKVLDALLDAADLEAGRVSPSFRALDLAGYTRGVAAQFRAIVEGAGLRYSIDCQPLPDTFFVDAGMWEKIVLHLVSNALKRTFEGEIAIELHPVPGGAELVVRDTGQGVAEEQLPQLFARFQQGRAARSRAREAVGVGLSLVRDFVAMHGGRIHVHSEAGFGATFRIHLRAGSEHLPPERIANDSVTLQAGKRALGFVAEASRWIGERAASPDSGQTLEMDAPRILVAGADADSCEYLRGVLARRWSVECVCGGQEVMRAIERSLPTMIVADVALPVLDGFALLETIRTHSRARHLPMLLLASHSAGPGRAAALEAGAIDYLVKPFSARELVASVAAALEAMRARREAEAANRAKDEFLALLGHELRNPLAPILTALELMRLKNPKLLGRERAVIERQVRHMVQLVDDLLDVSRVARGKVQVQLEIVEISKVIAQAVETVGPLLEQRQHQLSVSVPHSGLLVRGDPFRLAQVFANLLTNSAKYTPSGGQIWLDAHRNGERVIVAVRDNGSGIAPTMLEHIFEPFVQGERPGEATPGGLGLGLPLVRSLLKLHEGTVRAESDGPGTGSAFIVELPFCSTVGRNPSSAEGDGRGESAGGKRLLVVDDNADAAEMMAEGLRVLGYDVRVAYDGPSALALARDFVPEYAVLDVGLPLMDGYELGERLREALGHSLVLVAVTGYSRERDTARAIPTAFSAHLVKPIDLGLLARTLDSAAVKSADSGRS